MAAADRDPLLTDCDDLEVSFATGEEGEDCMLLAGESEGEGKMVVVENGDTDRRPPKAPRRPKSPEKEILDVESVILARHMSGGVCYLLNWADLDRSHWSFEPRRNLSPALLDLFHHPTATPKETNNLCVRIKVGCLSLLSLAVRALSWSRERVGQP